VMKKLAHLPAHDAHVVCLDADRPAIARQPATAPAASCRYTPHTNLNLGSTDTPNGVAVTHGGILTGARLRN
jgi:hypothetical protein